MLLSLLTLALVGCEKDVDSEPCEGDGALMACSEPTQTADYYAAISSSYFDTMDYRVKLEAWPPYAETVARWEWPPWLKLTAYGREDIEASDTLLTFYPSIVEERDCRGFDTQPFGRCRVTFYYDDHDGKPCPIYEEFTFNDAGEVTWIEAWSDLPGFLPMADADAWAEGEDVSRLSAKIPGLGTADGRIDLDSEAMAEAEAADADVADFVWRARDWQAAWIEETLAAGDGIWEEGCGW